MPRPGSAPRLTVVLICYNMAREIPRTVRSLSAGMQAGMAEDDYEILLVDNGSTQPFDEDLCRQLAPNLRVIHAPGAGPSPVPAINLGLGEARGNLVGVFIDGARMASPGLLCSALAAAQTHPRPVVGSLAFHLGPDVQSRSITQGYCQAVEDRLLDESCWEADGYRLFDISVFARSSRDGWFTIPAETNAVFMMRPEWNALGGYDPGFVTPGGGLANLDLWARACQLPQAAVIMLLGEATFHQVHGGIATNSAEPKWDYFHEEYIRLRGHAYQRPQPLARHYGSLDHIPRAMLQLSLDRYYAPHEPR